MITDDQLEHWFMYHAPVGDQSGRYESIRRAGLDMARLIIAVTPSSADKTTAIRKIREAVMTANAAIACDGK